MVRCVISLTTNPTRLSQLDAVVSTLKQQTRQPDEIFLCVPYVFKRTEQVYDIEKLTPSVSSSVTVIRCVDQGPITKLVPALKREWMNKNTYILCVDDDCLYDTNLLEYCLDTATEQKADVVANVNLTHYTVNGNMAEGVTGFFVRVGAFQEDFWDYLDAVLKDRTCYVSDDYVISNYFHYKGIKITPNKHVESITHRTLPQSFDNSGLRTIDPEGDQNGTRYRDCGRYIKGTSKYYVLEPKGV